MEHGNSALFRLNSLIVHNVRAPTRTPEQAIVLHQKAAVKYKHVLEKLRNITDDQQLSLRDMYSGFNRVVGVPKSCDLHVPFLRFEDIARANFVAHHDLDDEANKLIFYYGMDQLHTFNIHLRQSYFNIVLAVFTLASGFAGRYDSQYECSAHLWCAFIFAWLESITSRSEDVFTLREEFLEVWRKSKYDLTYFSNIKKKRMEKALNELKAGKPPVEGDPIEFLDKCRRGDFNREEFGRVGVAMAMHWIIAQLKHAKEEKEKKNEEKLHAAEAKRVMRATYADVETSSVDEWEDDSDNDSNEGSDEDSDEDEEEGDTDVDEDVDMDKGEDTRLQDDCMDMELDDDEMELDLDELEPIPEDIDLTRVDWDAPWMQALIDIDTTIKWKPGFRPKSDRVEWIDSTNGLDTIFTWGDELAEDLKKWLHLEDASPCSPTCGEGSQEEVS